MMLENLGVVPEVVGKIKIGRFRGGGLAARISSFVDLKANGDLTSTFEFSVKIFIRHGYRGWMQVAIAEL